jgi:restriction system protein
MPLGGATSGSRRGAELLGTNPVQIDTSTLEKYQEFRAFRSRRSEGNGVLQPDLPMTSSPQTATSPAPEATPEELFSQAYQRLRSNLEAEVLEQVKAATPAFFERLVIDLLVAMGYGGSRQDAGRAVGRSGDGGIDGIIKEDKLGLDVIYVQAKRWEGTVGRPEIQKFAGALQGQRANKGFSSPRQDSRERPMSTRESSLEDHSCWRRAVGRLDGRSQRRGFTRQPL